jgi:transcriptional regulator with XRE-family HTH domain
MPRTPQLPPLSRFHAAFGSAIRVAREERDLTQPELAAEADVDLSRLGKIERGQANATLRIQARIVAGLGVGNQRIGELMDRYFADHGGEGSAGG